jgi:hypothetical protein
MRRDLGAEGRGRVGGHVLSVQSEHDAPMTEPGYRVAVRAPILLSLALTAGARAKTFVLAARATATPARSAPIVKSTQNAGRASEREGNGCAERARAGRARD